jgi:Type III restriction enzyme, res subunit
MSSSSRSDQMSYKGLTKTTPRPVQIAAYRRALLADTIVVFPTGAGKTLVASMLINRMVKQTEKLAVLIVDRIPLIDQHKRSIEFETNLVVETMSGECNRVSLSNGFVQVLIATGGAFYAYMRNPKCTIRLSQLSCVVFDECHHVVGDHVYKRILKDITTQCQQHGPRLLGLTASPCKAKTVQEAQNGLVDLREAFGEDTLWFRPDLSGKKRGQDQSCGNDTEITWVKTADSELQKITCAEILGQIQELISQAIGIVMQPDPIAKLSNDTSAWDRPSLNSILGGISQVICTSLIVWTVSNRILCSKVQKLRCVTTG